MVISLSSCMNDTVGASEQGAPCPSAPNLILWHGETTPLWLPCGSHFGLIGSMLGPRLVRGFGNLTNLDNALHAVMAPTSNSVTISRQEALGACSSAILQASTTAGGLPIRFP